MPKRLWLIPTVLLLSAGPPAWADDAVEKLQAEFDQAMQAFWSKYADAEKAGEKADVAKLPPFPATTYVPKFRALAEERAGTSEAIPVLFWLIANGRPFMAGPEGNEAGRWALERLTRDHAADPKLGEFLQQLGWAWWSVGQEPIRNLCTKVAAQNADRTAKSWARFVLARLAYVERDTDPASSRDPATATPLAAQFRAVATDFADLPAAKEAERFVYELENLQIGMKAPDIVGTDADGKELRLSQFAGQVVVLDFWGFW